MNTRRSLDPHRNIFFYYAGTAKSVGGRDRQLEDNSTKALVNLLELSAREDERLWLVREFLVFAGARRKPGPWTKFALQRATVGPGALKRAREKVLLGIAPKPGVQPVLQSKPTKTESRPDAWIWTPDTVICVETKVVGQLQADQLARHQAILGPDSRFEERTWRQVYAFASDALSRARKRGLAATTMLLDQFVEYLRVIAYRQEIDMGEFDGFRPEHFEAFTFLDDEEADDTRRNVKHYVGQFMTEVRDAAPKSLADFREVRVGNVKADSTHAWVTLSRTEKPVHEAHFSFGIHGSACWLGLLLEGAKPANRAQRNIEAEPAGFLQILRKLPDWTIALKRRWQVQARNYAAEDACSLHLDRVSEIEVDYLTQKMRRLAEKKPGQGYFELFILREFAVDDPKIRTKAFAKTIADSLEELVEIEAFLSRR